MSKVDGHRPSAPQPSSTNSPPRPKQMATPGSGETSGPSPAATQPDGFDGRGTGRADPTSSPSAPRPPSVVRDVPNASPSATPGSLTTSGTTAAAQPTPTPAPAPGATPPPPPPPTAADTTSSADGPDERAGSTPGAVNQERVNGAVEEIRDALSQGAFDWDVTHGDLNTIRDTLGGLNREDFNATISRLSDDELGHWMGETHGMVGGYTAEERSALFDTIAGRADAGNLDRIMGHLSTDQDRRAFGQAVAEHAPDAEASEFVQRAARGLGGESRDGIAIAETLGGMGDRPDLLAQTLRGLEQGQIDDIVQQATGENTTYGSGFGSGHITTTYNAESLGRMLEGVANVDDPALKAQVFEPAANALGDIEGERGNLGYTVLRGQSPEQIRDGLDSIMDSDVNGIVNHLETHDRDGRAMTSYLRSLVDNDQQDRVGGLLRQVMTGNDGNHNAMDRFTETVEGSRGANHYKNAQNLGYMVGATHAAIQDVSDSRVAQAQRVQRIFSAVVGAGGALAGPAGGVTSSALGGLSSEAVEAVTNDIRDGHQDLRNGLRELAFPRGQDNVPYEGPAEEAYDSAANRVIAAND